MSRSSWSRGVKGTSSRVAVVLAAVPLTGCSFVFVDAPPDHPHRYSTESSIQCTTSKAAPVIDTVIAGLEVVRTGLAAGASDSDYSGAPISRQADIGIGLGLTALFASSAIYGYVVTGKCKDMKGGSRRYEGPQQDESVPEVWVAPPQAAAPEQSPAAAPQPAARLCVPGTTQRCVGAGACEGGQACTADGMAWEPCACAEEEEGGSAPLP